ncbi:MAG: NapC/NirT family cytochrome c [Peptococcaceae bacterium]|nr:NapC/NirT family cytochrome c [Peptococcaceae bacterium]
MSVGRKMTSKIPKFDLSKTEDKLKLIILISGFIIVVGAVMVGALEYTMQSSFCGNTCHEMRPEYTTWEASAHSQIACVDCHIAPGIGNLIKDKLHAMVQVYQHVTHTYSSPIKYPWDEETIPNLVCLQCHSANRQYSPSGDIIIPHDKHIAKGVLCINCHKGVTHGMISERGVSKASVIPFDDWTVALAAKEMVPTYSSPRMDTCIACHVQRGEPTNCTTCHSQIGIPASHRNMPNWLDNHGIQAEKDIKVCDKCHSYGFLNPGQDQNLTVDQYARENVFCLNCHTKRPPNHGTEANQTPWIAAHGQIEKEKGIQNCLACHDIRPGVASAATSAEASKSTAVKDNGNSIDRLITDRPTTQMVNKVYCSTCHGNKFGS